MATFKKIRLADYMEIVLSQSYYTSTIQISQCIVGEIVMHYGMLGTSPECIAISAIICIVITKI